MIVHGGGIGSVGVPPLLPDPRPIGSIRLPPRQIAATRGTQSNAFAIPKRLNVGPALKINEQALIGTHEGLCEVIA